MNIHDGVAKLRQHEKDTVHNLHMGQGFQEDEMQAFKPIHTFDY